jgi:hypothetical protein
MHDEQQVSSTIDFQPADVVEYEGSPRGNIQEGVFYIPKSSNQVALDSFIRFHDFFYIFQISIASKHPIKRGIVSFFSGLGALPPKDRWRFVFVIPSGNNISCPQPRRADLTQFLEGIEFFSAEFRYDMDSEMVHA